MPRMSHNSSLELSRSLQTKTHCLSLMASLPFLCCTVYRSAMRTVWTMGFVAAAALSFCFPDFIVFRFTQAVIWSIALMGLVILCGISGQFSFAQAALFGIGGYGAALVAAHTALSPYVGLALAPLLGFAAGYGVGRVAGPHNLWTPGPRHLCLRHRLSAAPALAADRALDRRRPGALSRLPDAACRLPQQRSLGVPDGANAASRWNVAGAQPDPQPFRARASSLTRPRPCRGRAGHPRPQARAAALRHCRSLSRCRRLPVGLSVRVRRD